MLTTLATLTAKNSALYSLKLEIFEIIFHKDCFIFQISQILFHSFHEY